MLFGLPHWGSLEKNMTRTEFEQRVKDENLKMESYDIELDEYREEIRVMGCVQKNGKWIIYKTNERNGEAHIFKEYNSEDDAFEDYYELIKFYMEKAQM